MQAMRKHETVKLNRTLAGRKRWEIDEFERKHDDLAENMEEKTFTALENAIREQKNAVKGNDEPDYVEVAIVTPTPDYLIRRTRVLKPLVTIDTNKDDAVLAEEYIELFYKKFDLVTDLVCQCVRDPERLEFKLLVPDETKRLKTGQIRISDWNITIDLALIQSQGYICPLPTPVCAAFWIACQNAGMINIIRKKEATPEIDEDIESFPEDADKLAEDPEDLLLEGVSELPVGSDRPGPDDPGRGQGQDGHQGMGTAE